MAKHVTDYFYLHSDFLFAVGYNIFVLSVYLDNLHLVVNKVVMPKTLSIPVP